MATWWVGVILGVPLAICAQGGPGPKRSSRSLVRPIFVLLAVMGAGAAIAGMLGYFAASRRWMILHEPLALRVPAERHVGSLVDGFAHTTSYLVGQVGGIALCVRVRRARLRREAEA